MTTPDLPDPVIGGADAANDQAAVALARVGDLLDRVAPPSGLGGRHQRAGGDEEPVAVLEAIHEDLTRVLGTTAPSPRTGHK